jgi:hypothetical protein
LVAKFKSLVEESLETLSRLLHPLAPAEPLVALAANLALLWWVEALPLKLLAESPLLQGRWKAVLACREARHTWPPALLLTSSKVLSTTLEWSFQAPLVQSLKT